MDKLLSRPRLATKAAFIAVAVLSAASVLWLRQTAEALLRVDSFAGGVAEVLFWAAPTFVLYMLLARSRLAIVIDGCVVIVLLVWGWWSSATDWHSTASLGPGGDGLVPRAVPRCRRLVR
ncbi:MAG: hypothetical protein JF603_01785 [Acidobacteria bacterium]|nr:hypothetical protein [Acidobacteriota bacterium]